MCKKNQWVVHEVPISVPVYEIGRAVVKISGHEHAPMAAMICRNCGFQLVPLAGRLLV